MTMGMTTIEKGLACAYELAVNRERRQRARAERDVPPPLLTAAELARQVGISPSTIRRWIDAARHEYVGTLSDRGWRAQQQRRRDRSEVDCATDGCTRTLPPTRHGNQRYCSEHGKPAARVARHRRPSGS